MQSDYNSNEWNIYPFHFSDGDNWSTDDTKLCLDILDNDILPNSNVFCYGQVESRYGSGQFYKDLNTKYGTENDEVILSKIKSLKLVDISDSYFPKDVVAKMRSGNPNTTFKAVNLVKK